MSWAKLDDQFFAHPKVIDLSKDAKLLFLAGLTYSAAQLTDGFISPGGLRMISALVDVEKDIAGELIDAGLWEQVSDYSYQIHDYREYNPDAETVKKNRDANARRQQEWRDRRHDEVISNGLSNDVSNGKRLPAPSPSPSPIPNPVLEPDSRESQTSKQHPVQVGGSGGRAALALVPQQPKPSPLQPVPKSAPPGGEMPPEAQADHALYQELVERAEATMTKGMLTKAHRNKLTGWFNEHKRGLTSEIIQYGADETAGNTGGDALNYMLKVMANEIANPGREKPNRSNNGHGGKPKQQQQEQSQRPTRYSVYARNTERDARDAANLLARLGEPGP